MPDSFDPYRKWLGIPSEEQPPHHYRLLGIPLFETDPDVIENAAHRQMVYVRTLQSGKHADLSQKLLNELAAAKVCLMTREKKAAYDQELQARLSTTGPEATLTAAQGVQGDVATLATVATTVAKEPPIDRNSANSAAVNLHVSSASTDHAHARRPTRQPILLVPVLFGALGVLAVVVIVTLLALNFKLEKSRSGTVAGQGTASHGTSTGFPATGFGEKTRPGEGALKEGGSGSSAAGDTRPPSPREERIRQQLPTVRAALAARDLPKAKSLLLGLGTPTRDLELRAEKERLELVHRFLIDFWSAVQRGPGRVKSRLQRREGEPPNRTVVFEYFGVVIELQCQENADPLLTVDGKPWQGPLTSLPPKPAAALAVLGLEETDGFGRFYVATFLLMDGQGNRAENRKLGEAYYRLAERMVGQPNFLLADEFQLGAATGDADDSPISPEMLRVRPKSP